MKRIIILLIMCNMFGGCALWKAQRIAAERIDTMDKCQNDIASILKEQKKAAVLVLSNDGRYASLFEAALFTKSTIVNRHLLSVIEEEQRMSMSGFMAEDDCIRVGRLVGARQILLIEAMCPTWLSELSLSIKLIDSETTKVLYSTYFYPHLIGKTKDEVFY